jgi:hypothetical protein
MNEKCAITYMALMHFIEHLLRPRAHSTVSITPSQYTKNGIKCRYIWFNFCC